MKNGESASLHVLGNVEAVGGPTQETTVPFRRQSKLILAYLSEPHILNALGKDLPTSLSRSFLAESVAEGKETNFRSYLAALKTYLKEAGFEDGFLRVTRKDASLSVDSSSLDALQFISAFQMGTPESFVQALGLYKGAFAEDLLDHDFEAREALQAVFDKLQVTLIERLSGETPSSAGSEAQPPYQYNSQVISPKSFIRLSKDDPDVLANLREIVSAVNGVPVDKAIQSLNWLFERHYRLCDFSQAITAYERAVQVLQGQCAPEIIVKLWVDASGLSLRNGDIPSAEVYLHKAKVAEPRKSVVDVKSITSMAFGQLEYQRGGVVQAYRHYVKAYQQVEKAPNVPNRGERLAEIAVSIIASVSGRVDKYIDRKDKAKAIQYMGLADPYLPDLQRAFESNSVLARRSRVSAGILTFQKAKTASKELERAGFEDEAIQYFLEAKDISRQAEDIMFVGISQNNLACVYYDRLDFERAAEEWEEAADIFVGNNAQRLSAVAFVNVGCSYYKLARYTKSEEAFLKAIDLYFELGLYDDVASEGLHWVWQMLLESAQTALAHTIQILKDIAPSQRNQAYVVEMVKKVFKALRDKR